MNEKYINQIIHGDCIEKLKLLKENSIDLIFADPPYNLQLKGNLYRPNQTKVNAVDDDWDQFNNFKEYDDFTYKWLIECKRVLKPSGTIWVIGSYHNIFRVGTIMQNLGFWILNDVLWIKTNPMPNFKGTRFNNAHETLIWASDSNKNKIQFNYKSMKIFNDDKQLRSDWYIPICNGRERIKDENGNKAHSTQKPYELLYRVIMSTSKVGDLVLDPFSGTGTTAAVAKHLSRNFIAIEKEEKYLKVSKKRIENVIPLNKELLQLHIEDKPPKVPFGNLIESGYIKAGDKLFSKDKKYEALVMANATINTEEYIGSIHSVSAKLLAKQSNNGWMFWYVMQNDKLICINELREDYIKKFIKG